MTRLTEADTCRLYVTPALVAGGWDTSPAQINEQRTFTDGQIRFIGGRARRGRARRADYILRSTADHPLAVVEAKPFDQPAGDGVEQALEYAAMLGLTFAYATNGRDILEMDLSTGGGATRIGRFPTPQQLWDRKCAAEDISSEARAHVLAPTYPSPGKRLRYYQEIAVLRAVQALASGRDRALLTLCTGSGKTPIAFQICWKLWTSAWNRRGDGRRPRMLFLADRNILVDDPMAKDFAPFGDARWKIEGGHASTSRDMYFAIYQAVAEDTQREGLFRQYPRDFFDLIVIDECHRGSSRNTSSWRRILEWFSPAAQLGLTATPRREETGDTYDYFGDPLYEYSLAQGIADGFLAPYRVHRVVTDVDAAGWRPTSGELDLYGREVPDDEYQTGDFERVIALRARTEAIAKHLSGFLRETNPLAKTIVFCVDQEHAAQMRDAIARANPDLTTRYPDYVRRVTAHEGDLGRASLEKFQDVDSTSPVILTTSQLLTTGVDAPTCTNIAIARMVGAMAEFKQIIGRGTRLREDHGKLAFNIIDYTGAATEKFADPEFDGEPVAAANARINASGEIVESMVERVSENPGDAFDSLEGSQASGIDAGTARLPRKLYVDGGPVEIAAHIVYELDADGRRLSAKQLRDYAGDNVRALYPDMDRLLRDWSDATVREDIIEALEERGIDLDHLAETLGVAEADPFDLICHLAYAAPLRTRRERADRFRRERAAFLERYSPAAREVLSALLDKYADYGAAQFKLPDTLEVPPISKFGNPAEIIDRFGDAAEMREAVEELQRLLYRN